MTAAFDNELTGQPLSFDSYQVHAATTAIYKPQVKIMYPALGLAGEAGEACNKVKKVFRDDDGILSDEKRAALKAELGDVLWYLAALATDIGVNLSECASDNLDKLFSRKERGTLAGSGDNR